MNPLPSFDPVRFDQDSIHVINNSVHSTKLLLLEGLLSKTTSSVMYIIVLTNFAITVSSSVIFFSMAANFGPTTCERGCLFGSRASSLLHGDRESVKIL